jgi:hypothetical protein
MARVSPDVQRNQKVSASTCVNNQMRQLSIPSTGYAKGCHVRRARLNEVAAVVIVFDWLGQMQPLFQRGDLS